MQWLINLITEKIEKNMAGMIMIWSGAIVDIPDGWVLCDGNNGTPDLRNRFVPGAGSGYAVGATGGSVNHAHAFTSDTHDHILPSGKEVSVGEGFSQYTDSVAVTGTSDNGDGRPPYHALAFIMKT